MATKIQSQISSSASQAADVRFVDLSEKTTSSKQVREGFVVPATTINKQKAEFTLERLPQAPRPAIPRVVTQSIAAGTRVSPGTVVDLVLAPKQSLPFGIFDGVHADLQNRTIDFLDDVIEDPDVRKIVLTFDSGDTMTASDKQVITTAMAKKQITPSAEDADRSFNAMFEGLRTAAAFR
jgi:hypothetical protein